MDGVQADLADEGRAQHVLQGGSKDAQPDGLADAIEQRFGLSVQAEVTQVENGQADDISNVDQLSVVPIPTRT